MNVISRRGENPQHLLYASVAHSQLAMNLRVFFLDNKIEHEGVKVKTEPSSVGKNLIFQKSYDDCSDFVTLTPEGSVGAGVLTKALTLASVRSV